MTRAIRRAPWQRPKPLLTLRGSTIDPALRAVVRERAGGHCECCGDRLSRIFQCHHRKLRSRGGQDSAANLAALCGLCHRRVHSRVEWATEQGFIVSAFDDPARMPMAVRCEDWRYLTSDGHYRAADAALHHHKRPASANDLAPVVPISPRASRAHTREPLPAVKRHVGRGRQGPPVARSSLRVAVPAVGSGTPWLKLAECESSGDWHANTGNSFYGGLQIALGTWRDFGGLAFASRPDLATPAEQSAVAQRILRGQGWNAWPVCSWRAGVR